MICGSVIALDIFPKHLSEEEKQSSPIVVIVPGIFGDSGDHHFRTFTSHLWEHYKFHSIVFNRIGYSNMPHVGERLTSFDCYPDFNNIMKAVKEQNPDTSIYLFGASLGAAFIQRYLQEYSGNTYVTAASSVSSPWNVWEAAKKFDSCPIIRTAAREVQKLMMKAHLHEEGFLRLHKKLGFCTEKLKKASTPHDFFKVAVKELGCEGMKDYFERLDSHREVEKIQVPFLNISSLDDRVCDYKHIPVEKMLNNSNIIHVTAQGGGHISYFSGMKPKLFAFELAGVFFEGFEKECEAQ